MSSSTHKRTELRISSRVTEEHGETASTALIAQLSKAGIDKHTVDTHEKEHDRG